MSINEITAKIESLKEWEALAAEAAAQVESLKDDLKKFMDEQGVEEYEVGTHIIRWTTVLSNRFDSTGFKKVIADNMTADKLSAINERRAAQGKAPTTLAGIVYRAARASIAAINYSEKKHAAASVRTVKNEDGEEADYIDTMTASGADTEAAAILSVDLQQFITGRDSTDQQIISGLMEQQTERELAAAVGISAPAVHKRIAKIRAALEARQ